MTCAELSDSYDTFALGIEDGPLSSEIAAHLRRDCDTCVPAIRKSFALAAALGMLAESKDPPARLRRRVLSLVSPEARSKGSGWSVVWAAAALTAICIAALLAWQLKTVAGLRAEETARTNRVLSLIGSADSQVVSFGTDQARPPRGRVVINKKRGVVLLAANLPPLGAGKTFELWVIPRAADAKPVASGTFHASQDGSAVALATGEVWLDVGTVAVTVEKEGGVAAPTTQPIIAVSGL